MKQENKQPTSFRLLFYVIKELLPDCSGGQASPSRQNWTLLELRQMNIDTDVKYKVCEYDKRYHIHTLQTNPRHGDEEP